MSEELYTGLKIYPEQQSTLGIMALNQHLKGMGTSSIRCEFIRPSSKYDHLLLLFINFYLKFDNNKIKKIIYIIESLLFSVEQLLSKQKFSSLGAKLEICTPLYGIF